MTGTIFLLSADGRLERLEETRYESEDLLQGWLAAHPELLAGDQIGEGQPLRWLLIQREMGVAPAEGAASRWSLDHLFLDQNAVPTLVEVKRSSDTRLRREVVGQMLDYAANGVKHWPIAEIRRAFEARCDLEGEDPEGVLAAFLQGAESADVFWSRAADNLALGRLRLLFVADVIPSELQRVVEFLNEQMVRTEVLAVEIRQFAGATDSRTLVPRVFGRTAAAQDLKSSPSAQRERPWDVDSYLAKLESENRGEELDLVRRLFRWTADRGLSWRGGRGAAKASLSVVLEDGREPLSLYEGTSRSILHVQFFKMGPEFEGVEARRSIADLFNAIPGISMDPERPYPGIRFDLLDEPRAQEGLFEALDGMLERLRSE
jgi:hypothetical protein